MDLNNLSRCMCHRKPERSFFIRGHQFPVCARCTGLYLGTFLYAIYAQIIPIHYTINHLYIAIILIIPCFIDGFTQFLKLRESNNILRFTTGFIAAIGLLIFFKIIKLTIFG